MGWREAIGAIIHENKDDLRAELQEVDVTEKVLDRVDSGLALKIVKYMSPHASYTPNDFDPIAIGDNVLDIVCKAHISLESKAEFFILLRDEFALPTESPCRSAALPDVLSKVDEIDRQRKHQEEHNGRRALAKKMAVKESAEPWQEPIQYAWGTSLRSTAPGPSRSIATL